MFTKIERKFFDQNEINTDIEHQICLERQEQIDLELDVEEHPELYEEELGDPTPEKKTRKAMKEEMLHLLEQGAETLEDYQMIVAFYDLETAALERRARYHEVGRGDVPLEFNACKRFPLSFPKPGSYLSNNRKGLFLDLIFDCPYEIHQIATDPIISKALASLSEEQKEIIHLKVIRQYRTEDIAAMRGQSRQNINKVYRNAMKKVRKAIGLC